VESRPGLKILSLLLMLAPFFSACGFHLRQAASLALPASLSTLRVTMSDNRSAYPPLLVEMRNALHAQSGVIVEAKDTKANVPLLDLFGEYYAAQVLAVDTSGKVSAYLLNYSVSFKLADAAGKDLITRQRIKLQREYTFDQFNVLAKEKEEQYLRDEMRRDAVQQILRQLAAVNK
jgi:LPS-assembly lipoprotein